MQIQFGLSDHVLAHARKDRENGEWKHWPTAEEAEDLKPLRQMVDILRHDFKPYAITWERGQTETGEPGYKGVVKRHGEDAGYFTIPKDKVATQEARLILLQALYQLREIYDTYPTPKKPADYPF